MANKFPHPRFTKHAQAVKQTHATLSKTPGFREQPAADQFKQVQQTIKGTK